VFRVAASLSLFLSVSYYKLGPTSVTLTFHNYSIHWLVTSVATEIKLTHLGYLFFSFFGRAMAQAARLWPLAAEVLVHALASSCGICGRQSGTGTGFSPARLYSTIAPHLSTTAP
jgi:hypothetical protein